MSRISRRFALLAPILLGSFLWMGVPSPADAGGRKHGHDRHHGGHHGKYHGGHHGKYHGGHHHKHYKHYSKHHGWRGHDGWWYGGYPHYAPGYYYPAPVALGVYLDGPCGHYYESWDHFSHHVHHHHGVAFVDLPGLLVETSFGFAFHR